MTSPLFMRDVTLNLRLSSPGTGLRTEFNCDLHTAEIVPTPGDEVSYSTLCASGSYSSRGKTTYALHVVAAQRWDASGLAAFLWDNDGALADFQYQAHGAGVAPSATAPGMTGQVMLIAGNYGGEVDTYPELEVEMPCTSKPTKISAAFPATFGAAGEESEAPAESEGAESEVPAEEPAAASA